MNQEELNDILNKHELWFERKGGKRATLTGANLTGVNLTDANLTGANLTGADLWGCIGNGKEIKSLSIFS